MKDTTLKYIITIILMLFIGAGSMYLLIIELNVKTATVSGSNGTCYTSCEDKVTITDTGISSAVEKIYDAVVIIENYKNNTLSSTGTGFVYKVDENYGYIITNYHVAGDSQKVVVIMSDDTEVNGTYLGGDQYMDISVIKIDSKYVTKVAEIGDSNKTQLGDTVFTVGTPVGYDYRGTVTRGILSGKDRLVEISISGYQSDWVMKVLQTDAAINPGNSGGPLVNSNGEVIGVNSLKIVNNQIEGMGFAIPIEDVMVHIATYEKGESIDRPALGVSMLNTTETFNLYRNGITLDKSIESGVVIASVEKDYPAYGKLQKGDVIVKINNDEIENISYFKYNLYKYQVGDTIKITYIKDGKTSTIDIILNKVAE